MLVGFIVGFVIGLVAGVMICALCVVASQNETESEILKSEIYGNNEEENL